MHLVIDNGSFRAKVGVDGLHIEPNSFLNLFSNSKANK